jgi:chorismate mutase/prephenate dehydrogenase
MSKEDLNKLRLEIADVDKQILKLAANRIKLAQDVGRIKAQLKLPVKDFRVEKEVLERNFITGSSLGLYKDLTTELSQVLIKYAVLVQDEYTSQIRREENKDFKNILIVGGFGGMGRWMSQFFRSFGHQISIYDPSTQQLTPEKAEALGVVTDLAQTALESDMILVATPLSVASSTLQQLIKLEPKGIILDICSLKSPVVDTIQLGLKQGLRMASIHPMFGPQVDILAGHNIILCDFNNASINAEVAALFQETTANLITIPIEDHDRLMGYVLGLSHMVNLVFAQTLVKSGFGFDDFLKIASTTFRSQIEIVKPVANENQDLYFEIQTENNAMDSLYERFGEQFRIFKDTVKNKDRTSFRSLMEASKTYLNSKEIS